MKVFKKMGNSSKKESSAGEESSSRSGKVGSSAWRRRMEETMYQKLGLAKGELDENTENLEELEMEFHSSVESLQVLSETVNKIRKAHASLREGYDTLSASCDEAPGLRVGDEMRDELLRDWVAQTIAATLENAGRVEGIMKQRNDLILDYFARKRKSSKKDEDSARAKFEQSKSAVKTITAYLKPVLEAFVVAAKRCRSDSFKIIAVIDSVFCEHRLERLGPAAEAASADESTAAHLLTKQIQSGAGPEKKPPPTEPFKNLVLLLETPPRLAAEARGPATQPTSVSTPAKATPTKKAAGAVYGGKIDSTDGTPVRALVALLDFLVQNGGLDRQGIFRIPGNTDDVENAKKRLDEGESSSLALEGVDVDDVATLTKMWFRERPDPGFLDPSILDGLRVIDDQYSDEEQDDEFAAAVSDLLRNTSHPSAYCLSLLLSFLAKVAANSAKNMMTSENIAICFAPNILLKDPSDPASMLGLQPAIALMERLVHKARAITREDCREQDDRAAPTSRTTEMNTTANNTTVATSPPKLPDRQTHPQTMSSSPPIHMPVRQAAAENVSPFMQKPDDS